MRGLAMAPYEANLLRNALAVHPQIVIRANGNEQDLISETFQTSG